MSRPGNLRPFRVEPPEPEPAKDPDLLTIDELAVKLRISISTIHRRRRAGVFPIAEKKGLSHHLRFSRVAVEKFLASER